MKDIKSNDNIVITKADMGCQIVILYKKQYIDGVRILINDGPHKRLSRDPSSHELSRIKYVIKSCSLLSKATQTYIPPPVSNCGRFHALRKVHKPNITFSCYRPLSA